VQRQRRPRYLTSSGDFFTPRVSCSTLSATCRISRHPRRCRHTLSCKKSKHTHSFSVVRVRERRRSALCFTAWRDGARWQQAGAPEHSFCLLLASKQATRIISNALQRTLLRVMEDGLNCPSRDCHFIANFLCRVGLGFAPPEPRSSGQGRKHLFQILMNRDRSNMWILAKLSAISTALALFRAEIKMNCDFFNCCSCAAKAMVSLFF
jgi:hypothetical protein